MKLNFEYDFLDHPYADEPGSIGEVWSVIRLKVLDEQGNLVKTALDWQWDIIVFLNWLIENESDLRHENAPNRILSTSIAKGVYDYYRNLGDEIDLAEEKVLEKVFEYRERHGLRFALRGTDIDDIYIGLNKGFFTISLYNKKGRWSYNVAAEYFFKKVHLIYKEAKSRAI